MRVKTKGRMRRLLSWDEVMKMMAIRGWNVVKNEPKKKEWSRGNEKVSVFRTFEGKWKAEFFYGKRLQDSTGASDEFFARVIVLEFAALK